MGLKTTSGWDPERKLSPEERRKKVAELRTYHQDYFNAIGKPDATLRAKMRYGKPPISKFYEAEINESVPIYVEWTSRNIVPEDDRRLYRYDPNPNYRLDYEVSIDPDGKEWFTIPMDKFVLVKEGEHDSKPIVETIKEETKSHVNLELDFDFGLINPDEDCPMENITLRDWAAILLKTPVSRKEWLNKIIKDSCQK